MTAYQPPQGTSKKTKPEPQSPSPATPETAESQQPQPLVESPTAKVDCPKIPLVNRERSILNLPQSSLPSKEDFESYYMKRVTAEFADDIDKLRHAPDFSEQTVPVLIEGLRQGSKGFSEEEKERVMGGR